MTAIIFILIIIILVLSHEFGHFIAAKLKGVRVEEFAFGFPPRIFSFQRKNTLYSINLLPFGGFIRLLGEDGPIEIGLGTPKENFSQRNFFTKAAIIIAGIAFNLVLAYLLFFAGLQIGLPQIVNDNENVQNSVIKIMEIAPNSPAQKGGLLTGDTILKMESFPESIEPIRISDVQNFINKNKGKKITIYFEQNFQTKKQEFVPRTEIPPNEGALGIAMVRLANIKIPWHKAVSQALTITYNLTYAIGSAFSNFIIHLFKGTAGLENIAGPVGIFNIVGNISQMGFIYLLQLTALLSINLAVINIIPFPGLDGGRILWSLIEAIKGKPMNFKITRFVHASGFFILLLILLLVTYHDIKNINL